MSVIPQDLILYGCATPGDSDSETNIGGAIDTSKLIKPGVFLSEKLVNMSKHDYALEPNAMFSPDMKWLIFRSNLSGENQVYAVELEKAGAKVVGPAKANTGFQ